jgi:hypothetical protein
LPRCRDARRKRMVRSALVIRSAQRAIMKTYDIELSV